MHQAHLDKIERLFEANQLKFLKNTSIKNISCLETPTYFERQNKYA